MFLTDTHAHLHMKPLSLKADEAIKRALDANVKRMITIGIDLEDSKAAAALAEKHNGIYAAAGVHPHDAQGFSINQLGIFEKLLQSKKVIAVGEIGLDYFRNHSPKEKQTEVFSIMADMALGAELPLIIHIRDAAEDSLKILDSVLGDKDHKVLFHCFSGDETLLEWGMKRRNCMFSFAGNVTYPKAVELHSALSKLPVERLFIETDCPYLTPIPHRGKENEPHFITHTADFVANSKKITTEALIEKLEQNFVRFFGNLPAHA